MVKARFYCLERRRVWHDAEDRAILRLHDEYGTDWARIASALKFKGRTSQEVEAR
jgi:hypothetical protein